MIGFLVSHEFHQDVLEAVQDQEVWLEKVGTFRDEEFIQHCKAAANVNIQTLIVSTDCTDDEAIIKGIRQFRFSRNARILIIAPGKTPGDQTMSKLVSLGVYDIVTVHLSEESDQERPLIADDIKRQLEKAASYADASRWHVELNESNTSKQKNQEKRNKRNRRTSLFHPDDIQSLEMALPELEDLVKEKVIVRDRIVGTAVIAVTGVYEGVGTTHTSLLLANYLTSKNHRVAIVAANNSDDFETIEYVYEGMNGYESTNSSFEINGVQFIKSGQTDMAALLHSDFDYIILDIGFYEDNEWFEEFLRANIQIVVGAGADWRQREIVKFCQVLKEFNQSKWVFIIPFVDQKVIGDIANEIPGKKIYSLPAHPDPFKAQKDTDAVIDAILSVAMTDRKTSLKKVIKYVLVTIGIIAISIETLLLLKK